MTSRIAEGLTLPAPEVEVAVVSLGRQVEPGEQLVGLFSQVLLKSFIQLGTTIKELGGAVR